MQYRRMPIEVESPEELGYNTIKYNLAESSVKDRYFGDLNLKLDDLILSYGTHRGELRLREAILKDTNFTNPDCVLVTTGAAMALFLVATTLLSKEDHLVVIRPNYATNLETPYAIGCETTVLDLTFENQFDLDLGQLKAALQPNTRLISLTNPHNPTGKVFSSETIQSAIKTAKDHGCYLLLDETYRDLYFQSTQPDYAATQANHVISVCSLSKALGVPGIRVGWLICQDMDLMTRLLAAKEQIIIGSSVVDEAIAWQVLERKEELLRPVHAHIRANFEITKNWMQQSKLLEWVEPTAGVVGFPRLKLEYQLDFPSFKDDLYTKYQTLVGFGHWFEQENRYFRLGFGYPDTEDLLEGLRRLEACFQLHSYKK
jgi:aspartate/methionine/tyrosine aminotransferase